MSYLRPSSHLPHSRQCNAIISAAARRDSSYVNRPRDGAIATTFGGSKGVARDSRNGPTRLSRHHFAPLRRRRTRISSSVSASAIVSAVGDGVLAGPAIAKFPHTLCDGSYLGGRINLTCNRRVHVAGGLSTEQRAALPQPRGAVNVTRAAVMVSCAILRQVRP